MKVSTMRSVQSARTHQVSNLFKLYPNVSDSYIYSSQNSPSPMTDSQPIPEQRELIEQKQSIFRQILITKSQLAPLRNKAADLTEHMQYKNPALLSNLEEPEDPQFIKYTQLMEEKSKLDKEFKQYQELLKFESKYEIDINNYRISLLTITDQINRGNEILTSKKHASDVIMKSEIYDQITNQRKEITNLQSKLNSLIDEMNEISRQESFKQAENPETIKLNQKVMFYQKRLGSLHQEKVQKMEELARLRNNHSSRRSPGRAKSRRKMASNVSSQSNYLPSLSPNKKRNINDLQSDNTFELTSPRRKPIFNAFDDDDDGANNSRVRLLSRRSGTKSDKDINLLELNVDEINKNQNGTNMFPEIKSSIIKPPHYSPQPKSPRSVRFIFDSSEN